MAVSLKFMGGDRDTPDGICGYTPSADSIADGLGRSCCWRETWSDERNDSNYCVWHAPVTDKTTDDFGNEYLRERTDWVERLDRAFLRRAEIGAADFRNTTLCNAYMPLADLSGSNFENTVLYKANFGGSDLSDSFMVNTEIINAMLGGADLSGTDLTNTTIRLSDLERSDLTSADLHGAQITETALDGARMAGAQIDGRTAMLDHSDSIFKIRLCVYDPRHDVGKNGTDDGNTGGDRVAEEETTDKNNAPRAVKAISNDMDTGLNQAANTYRTIENLASKNARPELQATCYVRRQDIRRRQHAHAAKTSESLRGTISNKARSAFQWLSWATMKYGESPWRVAYTSLAVILLFGLVYPILGGLTVTTGAPTIGAWQPIGQIPRSPDFVGEVLLSLYFSVVTFTTLGYGDIQPSGTTAKLLAGVESMVGAVLIALLVAVLGRRLMR